MNNICINISIVEFANRQVAENSEIIKSIIEALLYTSRQHIAHSGHNESINSANCSNIIEIIKLLLKYHAFLRLHLDQINSKGAHNRVTFFV